MDEWREAEARVCFEHGAVWPIAGDKRYDQTTTVPVSLAHSLLAVRSPAFVLCCAAEILPGDSLAPCLPLSSAMRPLALGALLMLAMMMLMANSGAVQAATDAAADAADVAVASTRGQQQSQMDGDERPARDEKSGSDTRARRYSSTMHSLHR